MSRVVWRALLLMVLGVISATTGGLLEYAGGKAGGLFLFLAIVALLAAGFVLLCVDEN